MAGKIQDLKGKKGQIVKDITILDVQEGEFGTDIRVKEEDGEEYWTNLDQSITFN